MTMVTPDLRIKSVDEALDSLKYRGGQRREFLQHVIQPLYRDLEALLLVYDQHWTKLRIRIEDACQADTMDDRVIRALQSDLQAMRETKLTEGRAVTGIASRLALRVEEELSSFGRNVNHLFEYAPTGEGSLTLAGGIYQEVESMTLISHRTSLGAARRMAAQYQVNLRCKWAEVSKQYLFLLTQALR
jgi:hypothetical protein